MTPQFSQAIEPMPGALPIPIYLEQLYWWAYVHPRAVRYFERKWLVNVILLGNYRRLCSASLAELGETVRGRTLQLGCVYGNLTALIQQRMSPEAALEIVDILPIQLKNLARKLLPDKRITLRHGDSSSLECPDASYDQVLLFFLLHEQPEQVRRATLYEAMRVVKPGGRIVIVDYHRPRPWHPMRPLIGVVLRNLKPFAVELWMNDIDVYLPETRVPVSIRKATYFGALYQRVVLCR
jgi:ubiquinone/menaquinone biosynthesis C-methylase UbiE